MELWLDTANLSAIEQVQKLGVLHGVTTNPSLAASSGKTLAELLSLLLKIQNGPVAVQVLAANCKEMINQAEKLRSFSDRLIIKIPVTREGLHAISVLSKKGIPVMATAIFDANQIHLAAIAGARYLALYYSKICDADINGLEIFNNMLKLLKNYRYPSKVIAASLRSSDQVSTCAQFGVDAVTMEEQVFDSYLEDNPSTLEALAKFQSDWKKAPSCKVLEF